jgi:hypothetical protein
MFRVLKASLVCSLVALFLSLSATAHAASITLAWDASPDATVASYILRVGETPGAYTRTIDAGAATQRAVDGLVQGKTYYFVVSSRASDGEESDPSNEISFTVPVSGVPVFDGTNAIDLIVQDAAEGWIGAWTLNGTTLVDGGLLNPSRVPDLKWKVVGQGDFNNDNKRDLLWHHATTGTLAVWYMDGRNTLDVVYLNPNRVPDPMWKVVAVRDMNGDGSPDILWRHDTGGIAVWLMRGINRLDVQWITPSVPERKWKIVAAADFDGDTKTDILWQHDNGGVAVWLMDGLTRRDVQWMTPTTLPTGHRIHAVADANADGSVDMVSVDAEGRLAVWLTNRLQVVDGQWLSPDRLPTLSWTLAGPR